MLKITSRAIKAELERRGIKVEVLGEAPNSLLRYYANGSWHLLASSMPETTTGIGKLICDQKILATLVAEKQGVPVPATVEYVDLQSAKVFLQKFQKIVVKPSDAAHGNGVTTDIRDAKALEKAVLLAKLSSLDGEVLLQQQVYGNDIRMLVIGGVFAAAINRVPAFVIGDGKHTLRQLIELENQNPDRGNNYEKRLNVIDIEAATRYLGDTIDNYVPKRDEQYTVVGTANMGTGGIAIDYTAKVTQKMIDAAEAFSRYIGVAACGVDFMWDEVKDEFYFIEGNAAPSFGLHLTPSQGSSQPVDSLFVDFILAKSDKPWQTK